MTREFDIAMISSPLRVPARSDDGGTPPELVP
jgi:hypothetical protein